jgi:arabinose-5-phosphate isomerase
LKKTIIEIARECIQIERQALLALANHLESSFEQCVQDIFSSGARVVCCGIGKSALVAQKIVATMNSTGTASVFLHAADAVHGDVGMLVAGDYLCCFSKSGETEEIRLVIPIAKNIGCRIVAITANEHSYLSKQADYTILTPIDKEADPNNLAPTASTAAQMAIGDALAVCLLYLRGFTPADFAKFHPGGSLGKQLYLHVYDIYTTHGKPVNLASDSLSEVILTMSRFRLGATVIIDENERPIGIITDGDLRRMMEKNPDFSQVTALEIMNPNPKCIDAQSLAMIALDTMRSNNISQLVVLEDERYAGVIHLHDLIREGLI